MVLRSIQDERQAAANRALIMRQVEFNDQVRRKYREDKTAWAGALLRGSCGGLAWLVDWIFRRRLCDNIAEALDIAYHKGLSDMTSVLEREGGTMLGGQSQSQAVSPDTEALLADIKRNSHGEPGQ